MYETDVDVRHHCALKGDRRTMLEMNSKQVDNFGGSVMEMGKECPYAANNSFAACAWYSQE